MKTLLLVLTIFFVIIIIIATKMEQLTIKIKSILLALILIIIALAFIYESDSLNQGEKNRKILNAFNRGEDIICKKQKVNKQNYIFTNGTLSFSAKEEKKELIGNVFAIEECIVK